MSVRDQFSSLFYRLAAKGFVPARWFLPSIPQDREAKTGHLHLELVSHCWQYSHMLAYQLSSIVNYPPTKLDLTVTVFYAQEDAKTVALLDFFAAKDIPHVKWNWQILPKRQLFRRGIGRNLAARATQADWVWFTDCDIIFHQGCLDGTADALQGRNDVLVFPNTERTTDLLAESDPMLMQGGTRPQILDIDTTQFTEHKRSKAKGEFQITHGHVARTCGYCEQTPFYQKPADHWCKAYEDKAFRWLMRTDGIGLDIPAVYQIRHAVKGRYRGTSLWSRFRGRIRRIKSNLLKE